MIGFAKLTMKKLLESVGSPLTQSGLLLPLTHDNKARRMKLRAKGSAVTLLVKHVEEQTSEQKSKNGDKKDGEVEAVEDISSSSSSGEEERAEGHGDNDDDD